MSLLSFVLAMQLQALEPGVTTLPRFRASDVRVARDTAWFITFEGAEGAASYPLIGYVGATRTWISTSRRWREVDRIVESHERSGPVAIAPDLAQPIRSSHRLVMTDDPEAKDWITRLVRPSGAWIPLRFAMRPAERRRLYRHGRGSWPAELPPPGFDPEPSRWAGNGSILAFAFDGTELTDGEPSTDNPPPMLAGLLAVDRASGRLTTIVHPEIIGTRWAGLETIGRSVFAAPFTDGDRDVGFAAREIRLVRFDLPTKRWRFYRAADLPTTTGRVGAIASDGIRLFLVTENGVAVLDVRSERWTTLFYADTSLVLADGADSLVTRLVPTERSETRSDTTDSTATVDIFVDELGPRHRSAFAELVGRLVAFDTIRMIVDLDSYDDRGRDRLATEFNRGAELASIVLGRREFLPFLREAMFRARTQRFAAMAIDRIGADEVRLALRATLDSGTVPAALYAADTLAQLGDSAGVRWLRSHMLGPGDPVDHEGPGFSGGPWSTGMRAIFALIRHQDSASIPAILALMPEPAGEIDRARQAVLISALNNFSSLGALRSIARTIEARPWLWDSYTASVFTHPVLSKDPEILATVERIYARQRTMRR